MAGAFGSVGGGVTGRGVTGTAAAGAAGRCGGVTGRFAGGVPTGAVAGGCCGRTGGGVCGRAGAGTAPAARCAAKSCSIAVMRLLFDGGVCCGSSAIRNNYPYHTSDMVEMEVDGCIL